MQWLTLFLGPQNTAYDDSSHEIKRHLLLGRKANTNIDRIEKVWEFQKNIGFSDYAKAFAWITTNCGKFLKKWEYQTILLVS